MKRIMRYVLCMAVCLLSAGGLTGTSLAAEAGVNRTVGGQQTFQGEGYEVILSKVPFKFTVDTEEYIVFVKGLLEEEQDFLERAEAGEEEIAGLLAEDDNEVFMIPSGYTLDNTPVFLYVFITDGYTNQDAVLKDLDTAGVRYVYEILDEFYEDAEKPSYSAVDIGAQRFLVCDSYMLDDEGKTEDTPVKNYYTIWNGDFIQAELVYLDRYKDEAVSWAETFLESWTDEDLW